MKDIGDIIHYHQDAQNEGHGEKDDEQDEKQLPAPTKAFHLLRGHRLAPQKQRHPTGRANGISLGDGGAALHAERRLVLTAQLHDDIHQSDNIEKAGKNPPEHRIAVPR